MYILFKKLLHQAKFFYQALFRNIKILPHSTNPRHRHPKIQRLFKT